MKAEVTLRDLKEACINVFFPGDSTSVEKMYDIAVIDGKSAVHNDKELNQKRRTYGFYWKRKVQMKIHRTIIEKLDMELTAVAMLIIQAKEIFFRLQ